MSAFEPELVAKDEHDHTFRLNGTVFTCRPSMTAVEYARWQDTFQKDEVDPDVSWETLIQHRLDFIAELLEPGQEEAWAGVVSDRTRPLSSHGLDQLMQFALAQATGRPFVKQPDSGGSSATTGTSSTGASPSTEAT